MKLLRAWVDTLPFLLAAGLPLLFFYVLLRNPSSDRNIHVPIAHFYIVSLTSILVLILFLIVALAGRQLRNHQVTWLALAFVNLAGFFSIHGLSTPGFLLESNPVVSLAVQISLSLCAIFLYAGSFSSDRDWVNLAARYHDYLLGGWLLLLVLAAVYAMVNPGSFAGLFGFVEQGRGVIALLTAGFCIWSMIRFFEAYLYARLPLQAALALACGWLFGAQVIVYTGEVWKMSWWIYHVLLLLAAAVLLYAFFLQFARGKNPVQALRELILRDPLDRIKVGWPDAVEALVTAVEARDPYTAGHSMRVARLSLQLGEEVGLGTHDLRALAQGAILHDIGKIAIPDHVVLKKGTLTRNEMQIVQQHPVEGFQIARRVGSLRNELDIIRHHHESWDGNGYPDGLAGERIPFLARIVSIVDVYDALTSKRSYREAWTKEAAIEYINRQFGSRFDPGLFQPWLDMMDRQRSEAAAAKEGLRPSRQAEPLKTSE